jgi:hypothetical protein
MTEVFAKTKQAILREVRADRDRALEAYKSAGSVAVDTLVEIMVDPASTTTQRLAAVAEWNSILTKISRLNESAAARDTALAKVRQKAIDLVRARVDEKKETSFLIKEDKRLARRLKKAKKEDEEINPMMEVHVL